MKQVVNRMTACLLVSALLIFQGTMEVLAADVIGKPTYPSVSPIGFTPIDDLDKQEEVLISLPKMDIEKPSVSVSCVRENEKNGYCRQVTANVTASDEKSGLSSTPVSWDLGISWSAELSKIFTQNGTHFVWVRDIAGNIAKCTMEFSGIDQEPPEIEEVQQQTSNLVNGYTSSLVLVAQAEDYQVGMADLPYSWDGTKNWTDENTMRVTENGTYVLQVRDLLENQSEVQVVVTVVDNEAPLLVSENRMIPDCLGGYGLTTTFEIESSDEQSGLAQTPYSWDFGQTWTSETTKTFYENTEASLWMRDNLDNVQKECLSVDCIDREKPVIHEVTQTVIGEKAEYGEEVTLRICASDMKSGLSENCYSFDNGQTWSTSDEKTISENDAVYVAVRDGLGNQTKKTVLVDRIDDTAPNIHVTGNPTSYVNSNVTLTLAATDEQSGIESIWYQNDAIKAKTILGEYDAKASVKEKISIEANGSYRFILYDSLGNKSEEVVEVTKIKRSRTNPTKSSSSSVKRSSSSSSQETVTDRSIVTTIVEKGSRTSTTKQSVVVTDQKKTVSNGNQTGKSSTTRVVRQTEEGSVSVNEEFPNDSGEPEWMEEVESEETAQDVDEPQLQITYPTKTEDGVETQKIILVAVGIVLFLILVVFVVFYRMGMPPKKEEEE